MPPPMAERYPVVPRRLATQDLRDIAAHYATEVDADTARRFIDGVEQALTRRADSTEEAMAFARITVEPDKLEGKPCVRGLRITVETVVRLVAAGWSFERILEEYPDLERTDIQQALEYAAAATDVHVHRLRFPA
jgi:uncharacterized protein (DUF433 family)